MRRELLVWVTALGPFLGSGGLSAQEGGDCNVPHFDVWNPITYSDGSRISYFVRPIILCAEGVEIRADSAVVYEATNYTTLHGNVSFEDERTRLTAGQANYFTQSKQLRAWVNPVVTDLSRGSIIRGDTMVLLRASETRPQDRLTVTGRRPHATFYPATGSPSATASDSALAADTTATDTTVAGEASRVPDTLAIPDTLVVDTVGVPDSSGVGPTRPDSLPVDTTRPGDTLPAHDTLPVLDALAVPDTMVPPDTAVVSDSLAIPPTPLDSLFADTTAGLGEPPDTVVVVPDSATVDEPRVVATQRLAAPRTPADPSGIGLEGVQDVPEGAPLGVSENPYEVDADRMVLEGSGYLRATGRVIIRRDSLVAVADSVEYDEADGSLFLSNEARVETGSYDLTADQIWLDVPEDQLEGVRARDNAVLIGEDIRLLAPRIHLFLIEDQMERLVALRDSALDALTDEELQLRPLHELSQELGAGARFPVRPFAAAEDFRLVADSIEILAPGEVLQELKAIGLARGESLGRDSLNRADTPPLIRRDWLEGDTIVATFVEAEDSLPPEADTLGVVVQEVLPPSAGAEGAEADTTRARYRLEQLVAIGAARSLYRMEPSDSAAAAEEGRLAVSYVIGDRITILMSEGEVERMLVDGTTHGVHLEPVARGGVPGATSGAAADTSGAAPDTTGAVPDTARAVADTTGVAADTTSGFAAAATGRARGDTTDIAATRPKGITAADPHRGGKG